MQQNAKKKNKKQHTHRFDHSDGAQLCIAAAPHPPVLVLALLQQVLVASVTLLLVADPAAGTERHGGVRAHL